MDETPERFSYRCLPLTIANSYGWFILNPVPFVAEWNGGENVESVSIRYPDSPKDGIATSHFGNGVITFQINGLFRTETQYNLLVTGPLNYPKDAVIPLTGIVETDWVPFTFTMNWKFTRRNLPISFEKNEPFCLIFPVARGEIDQFTPQFESLDDNPELKESFKTYSESRKNFNGDLRVVGSDARLQKWQKFYTRGQAHFDSAPEDHKTSLNLKGFEKS